MAQQSAYPLLQQISNPYDLRRLPPSRLTRLVRELRGFLIDTVAHCGGHFAGSLGVAELTVALHYVFDTPDDRLVWDVGHQTYLHKVLTGRREQLDTIRRRGGVSGFPRRCESPYDTFGVGHSSTSISAALGMAEAAARQRSGRGVVAVIGDGALTGGIAYEALNHAGESGADLLVILNDNQMSISPNVGALARRFTELRADPTLAALRTHAERTVGRIPPVDRLARRTKRRVTRALSPGAFFEELGFRYFGPIDGHDIRLLVRVLRGLRAQRGPRLLHVITRKGKGYARAEADPVGYHAVTPFDPTRGSAGGGSGKPSYTQIFGDWLCDMAERDPRLVGITPAMREGSGMVRFAADFPERYVDVGIAEQHSLTFAAGLACEGLKPVVAIYSTFLQRAYDQLIHDIAIQNLPVLFAIDRAGLVGPDGATHAGAFDLAYLRTVPNLVVMAPADESECRRMLSTGFGLDQPAAVRYPRGCGPGVPAGADLDPLPVGRGEVRRRGEGVALIAVGAMVAPALQAGEALGATVANLRFIKPLDGELICELARSHALLVTIEDNATAGGAGSAVNEHLAAAGIRTPIVNLGLPDRFLEHGAREELLAECGLDCDGIVRTVRRHQAPRRRVDRVASA